MSTLEESIARCFGPDPYLGEPHPDTVSAVADLVRLMGDVSRARRTSLAQEPWRLRAPEGHLSHAGCHVVRALLPCSIGCRLDEETGLPEIGHAALRLAFALRNQVHGVSK